VDIHNALAMRGRIVKGSRESAVVGG